MGSHPIVHPFDHDMSMNPATNSYQQNSGGYQNNNNNETWDEAMGQEEGD